MPPIQALPGYDGRAFESHTLSGANLRLLRGDGTFADIVLPSGGSSTTPAVLQVGPSPHFMNLAYGGLNLNYAGIKTIAFYLRHSGGLTDWLADARMPPAAPTGSGYFYNGGTGGDLTATVDGTATSSFTAIPGDGNWHLVVLQFNGGSAGANLFVNQNNNQFNPNIDVADMRVYSRVWTSGEKANVTAASIPTDALLARYDFTSVTPTQVNDQSGNTTARPATFVGTAGSAI
jgi:hypothetical protein